MDRRAQVVLPDLIYKDVHNAIALRVVPVLTSFTGHHFQFVVLVALVDRLLLQSHDVRRALGVDVLPKGKRRRRVLGISNCRLYAALFFSFFNSFDSILVAESQVLFSYVQ